MVERSLGFAPAPLYGRRIVLDAQTIERSQRLLMFSFINVNNGVLTLYSCSCLAKL